MPKSIHLLLTVPDELDPTEIINIIMDDFYHANRRTEDISKHLENINLTILIP